MKTTKELLAEYNALMPETKKLSSWKGSKAELQKRLDEAAGKYVKKVLGKKKSVDLIDIPRSGDIKVRTAAEWSRELNKDPKVVRAKLRKAGLSMGDGWATIVEGSMAYKIIASIRSKKR
jgi:hypothetical protein